MNLPASRSMIEKMVDNKMNFSSYQVITPLGKMLATVKADPDKWFGPYGYQVNFDLQ